MITAISLVVCFIIALVMTPIIKKFAIKIGATDQPNDRKVHQKVMARIGGLAIFIAFIAGIFIPQAHTHEFFYPILIGAFIITLTGFLDDLFELSAKWKLLGQIAAASAVVIAAFMLNSLTCLLICNGSSVGSAFRLQCFGLLG